MINTDHEQGGSGTITESQERDEDNTDQQEGGAGMGELDSLSINGRLALKIIPPNGSEFGIGVIPTVGPLIPQAIFVELPVVTTLTGAISIAEDRVSEEYSIESVVWAVDRRGDGLVKPLDDEDPFSAELFLFSLTPWRSTISGEREEVRYDLITYPQDLPPRVFVDRPPKEQLLLSLPPRTEIIKFKGLLYTNAYIASSISGVQVIAYRRGERVSTIGETDEMGRFELQFWGDLAGAPINLIATPPLEEELPILLATAVVPSNTQDQDDTINLIAYPLIGQVHSLSIVVTGDSNHIWTLYFSQSWDSETLDHENELTAEEETQPSPRVSSRGAALWRNEKVIQSDEIGEVSSYSKQGVLFLQPPSTRPERTLRVIIPPTEEDGTLRVQPQPKVAVRGQIRLKGEDGVISSLYAKQIKWPWDDADHIPLGEYWFTTDEEGGFVMNLDPGEYVLTINPHDNPQIAPRVVLLSIPEEVGVILSPSETELQVGTVVTLQVDQTEERGSIEGSQVMVYCHIPSLRVELQPQMILGLQARSSSPMTSLSQGVIDSEGVYKFTLHSSSCPRVDD